MNGEIAGYGYLEKNAIKSVSVGRDLSSNSGQEFTILNVVFFL
jgi:hypothetical protein